MEDTTKYVEMGYQYAIDYGMKAVGAILILIIGSFVIKAIKGAVSGRLDKTGLDETLKRFFVSATSILLWTCVILAVLAKFGVEIAPIIAGLGIVGFTLGFALQGSLSNFASGVMIMILRPFKTGDYVDVGGTAGTVHEIGLLACIFNSPDNKKIIIPNSTIFGSVITNVTAYDKRRVDFTVGIGYGDDIDKAKQVCLEVVTAHEATFDDPAPVVFVANMGDSSVDLSVRCWSKTSDYWTVFFDCTEALKKALDREGIEIPFPQRAVWMMQDGNS